MGPVFTTSVSLVSIWSHIEVTELWILNLPSQLKGISFKWCFLVMMMLILKVIFSALEMPLHVGKIKPWLITLVSLVIYLRSAPCLNLLVGQTPCFAQNVLNWYARTVQSPTVQIVFYAESTPPLPVVHVSATLTPGHGTPPSLHHRLVNGTMSPLPWQSASTTVRPKLLVACSTSARQAHFAINVWLAFT